MSEQRSRRSLPHRRLTCEAGWRLFFLSRSSPRCRRWIAAPRSTRRGRRGIFRYLTSGVGQPTLVIVSRGYASGFLLRLAYADRPLRAWPETLEHGEVNAAVDQKTKLQKTMLDRYLPRSSDDFSAFVEYLAMGRRLIITSDHGYAATGYFSDADGEGGRFLKQAFASGRNKAGTGDTGPLLPPVALQMNSPHGAHLLALGRRKWRSQGGYPTLTHGGLSLLKVPPPFVELAR